MDCLQDYLQRKEENKGNKLRKSNFSLKNLLKEFEDIFYVQVQIGGEQLQNLNNQQQSLNAPTQRNSATYNQTKPQRDSLFARRRNNIFETSPKLQNSFSNPNSTINAYQGVNSKENIYPSTFTAVGSKVAEEIINGGSTLNSLQELRQILIALITNMLTWNRVLNGKKASVGEKDTSDSQTQMDSYPIELLVTEEQNQFFEYYKLKLRLYCPNSPFMPAENILLKYLNGVKEASINNACKRMILGYIQLVGPYKLNAKVVDEKYIEVSFDIFKDADVMDNREKANSFLSQSQIYSNYQFITPPLTATKSPANYGQNRSFHHMNKKKKILHIQTNSINYNIFNHNLSQVKYRQSDLQQSAYDQISSINRQLGESERLGVELNENLMNSNINIQIDQSLRQIQNNLQNSTLNCNSARDSVQLGFNSPDQFIYGEYSQDLQNTHRIPDLNQAMSTFFNRYNSPPPLKKSNTNKLIQVIPMKSKSSTNLDKLSESNMSKSGRESPDEYFHRRQFASMKLINDTSHQHQIHTITSIIKNIN